MVHLDFTRFDVADGGSLAILVSDLGSRTGIYWLTFDDGTEYVGQSIEIVKRLGSHRRRQPGEMLTVSFAPVPAGELDRAERWFIGERDQAKARLRNKLITRLPGGPTPGNFTVRPGVTVALPWKREDRARVHEVRAGIHEESEPRIQPSTEGQTRQWARLQRHEAWPFVREFLRAFVRETLSSPNVTAGRLWSVSAMPNTVRLPGWFRLCTLNVGRIEALYIGEDAARGTVVHWNIDPPDEAERADLSEALRRVDPQRRVVTRPHHRYADPVVALDIPGASLALDVLGLAPVAELAYRFNIRYQRQGMTLQSKGHNLLLEADLLGPR